MAAAPKTKASQGRVKMGQRTRASRERARTALQLERQEKIFVLNVIGGKSHREIAALLKIDKKTVASDIKAEAKRRAGEIAERRETEQAMHLARVDGFYFRSMELAMVAGSGALGAAGKALEMRAKILGLDAPTKVELGLQTLLDALDVPPDNP